jgi:ERCC4-type nuclease
MATMNPNEAVEVLRKLRERLESAHQDLSDDERLALDYATQELRRLEGFPDDRSQNA